MEELGLVGKLFYKLLNTIVPSRRKKARYFEFINSVLYELNKKQQVENEIIEKCAAQKASVSRSNTTLFGSREDFIRYGN